MRLKHVKGAEENIEKSPFVVQEPKGLQGKWCREFKDGPVFSQTITNNANIGDAGTSKNNADALAWNNPAKAATHEATPPPFLAVEIGMGKGSFITGMAMAHPDINYVGIEKFSSVLIRAVEKQEELQLSNLRLIRMDAEELEEIFSPGEVNVIYLNFSDPWPKDRHAKRRLTSPQFLERYTRILATDGRVEFKTDNMPLFDYSEESFRENGWTITAITRDLHNDAVLSEGNIMTEYEAKFSAKGNPIAKLIASPPRM